MTSTLLKGFCLIASSVFINLLIATFVLLPTTQNTFEPNRVQLAYDKEALTEAKDQLNTVREELEKTRRELIKAATAMAPKKDDKKPLPCDPTECDCWDAVKDLGELRKAMEISYGFRKSLASPLSTEVTSKLKRKVVPIPRVDGRKLSYKDFYLKFEKTQTPVIITNYIDHMFTKNWTLDYLREVCGKATAKLKHFDPKKASWGNLVSDKEETGVAEFIDKVEDGTAGNAYLFDWSIPRRCPELLESYSVPKYFATDYFQRVPKKMWSGSGGGYSGTWPSLFIGTGDTRSGLHIDSEQTHFWMAMLYGRKRWGIVTPDHVPFIYPDPTGSTFDIGDIFDVDVSKYPLVTKATIWEEILNPGDIVFVPGGSAHQIRNLETIISVSMNFVDEENVERHTALLQRRHPKAAKFMMDPNNRGVSSSQKDLSFTDFKTFPRSDEPTYDIFNY